MSAICISAQSLSPKTRATYLVRTLVLCLAFLTIPAMADLPLNGLKFEHDDTLWLTIGGGLRLQMASRNSDTDDSSEFSINSQRFYISGQLHEYFKFNINTEKYEGESMMTIDALLRFEFDPAVNLWVGRTLVPSDRPGLNGPYTGMSWNQYRQPLFSADYDGPAGQLGRSEGAVLWGTTGKFQYQLGAFEGLEDDYGNDSDHLLYAGRLAYNFLNVESNPGYYTSATYYGTQGNILTAAITLQSQSDGTGSRAESGDFSAYAFDVFSERVLSNGGVFNFEGGYKEIDVDFTPVSPPPPSDYKCFCLFDGDSHYATAGYLFRTAVGPGRLQPYLRYTKNNPSDANSSDSMEWGLNYVIAGNKASVNLNYVSGDTNASGYAGNDTDTVTLGIMLQFY
ncbi:MAG: hypothetical protein V7722_00135 [Porticoccus sp.]